jgi:hypothetical protein
VQQSCVISPGPWEIKVFPNPFRNDATIEFELSYADRVTLEIRDMKGKIVKVVFSSRELDKGVYTERISNSLAAGQYLITVRGRGTLATCRASVVN